MESNMLFLTWLAFAILVGVAADRRFNRSALAWTAIAMVASPLFGGLLLIVLGRKPEPVRPAPPQPQRYDHGVDWANVDWTGTKAPRQLDLVPVVINQPNPERAAAAAKANREGAMVAVVTFGAIALAVLVLILLSMPQ
jgi:hypothetical protein